MKVLWNGSWTETPEYELVEGADLVGVEASRPLVPLGAATGRVIRNPARRVWRFLRMEGPARTYRKARAKQSAAKYTGDYHVVLALGRSFLMDKRVVALGCHLPKCASALLVHRALVAEVGDEFSSEQLEGLAERLAEQADELEHLGRERYLYSGNEPPQELIEALKRALQEPVTRSADSAVLMAPGERSERLDGAQTLMQVGRANHATGSLPVALLGAGDYARTEIIPALHRQDLALYVVADREPQIAARVAGESGFALCTTSAERAIAELLSTGLVIVATAHDSHARLAAAALRRGHRVILEKPPVVTEQDLNELLSAQSHAPSRLEVGFNRRYVGLVDRVRAVLCDETGPVTVTCIVKELSLEPGHWYFWPNQGTRITGNLCHWIDLGCYLTGPRSRPVTVSLSPSVGHPSDEERVLTVGFSDDSLLTIVATSRGDETRGMQELIEVRRGETSALIDDLWRLRVLRRGRAHRHRALWRDKGHRSMYDHAIRRAIAGEEARYPIEDLISVSVVQITAARLAVTGRATSEIGQEIDLRLRRLAHGHRGTSTAEPS